VIGVILAALLMEGAARLMHLRPFGNLESEDTALGWALRPNAEGVNNSERAVHVKVNSAGFRDVEHPVQKPSSAYRIVVLGDSFVFGVGVEVGDRFTDFLPGRLSGCSVLQGKRPEVINMGVAGYGPAQELILARQRAFAYQPDLVIQAFYSGNDVGDSNRALHEGMLKRPYFVYRGDRLEEDDSFRSELTPASSGPKFGRWLRSHSALIETFVTRLWVPMRTRNVLNNLGDIEKERRAGKPTNANLVLVPPATDDWRDAWRVVDALVTQTAREVRDKGVRYLLVEIPPEIEANPDAAVRAAFASHMGAAGLDYPTQRLTGLAGDGKFEFLPLGPSLLKSAEERRAPVYGFDGSGFGHWNDEGHRAAADAIARYLCGPK